MIRSGKIISRVKLHSGEYIEKPRQRIQFPALAFFVYMGVFYNTSQVISEIALTIVKNYLIMLNIQKWPTTKTVALKGGR